MMNNLVGKYAIIAYSSDIMLENLYKITEHAPQHNRIKVLTPSGLERYYMMDSVLAVFNTPEECEHIFKAHKKFLKWRKKKLKHEKHMRKTLLSLIKDF